MSDRKLVTIDSAQFAKLEKLLGDVTGKLDDKLAHIERTLNGGFKALAQGGGGSDNTQVLTAIRALDDKIGALALSIKEDNNAAIRALANDVKSVREKLQTSIDNQTKGD